MKITCPEDIVGAVPQMIGFHPSDSVVVMLFPSDGGRSCAARVDHPRSAGEACSVVASIGALVRSIGSDALGLLVSYTDDEDAMRCAVEVMGPALSGLGAPVREFVWVRGGEFATVSEGGVVDSFHGFDASIHPYAVENVLAGRRAPLESREAVAAQVVAEPSAVDRLAQDEALDRLARVCGDPETVAGEAAWTVQRMRRLLEGEDVGLLDTARILAALTNGQISDEVAMVLEPAQGWVDGWSGLLSHATPSTQAGAAGVLALAAWVEGNGALAWCAVDAAQAVEPEHPLASLVARMLTAAVPPSVWPEMRRSALAV